jgi:hypothetical protein
VWFGLAWASACVGIATLERAHADHKVGPARGGVAGRILREDTGAPIAGARVDVVGTNLWTETDVEGRFRLSLPPGTYELRLTYDVYQPRRVRRVVVREGKMLTFHASLRRGPREVLRVIVEVEPDRSTAAALLVERRKAAATSDAVSAEQIAKGPDATAGDAIKRVVGATVLGGRYVYVRGLGDRYGNTQLNGAFLPSSEPDRSAVPLDVLPSGLLSNMTVRKSFVPDMPGDFAGGSLNIETREFPEKPLLAIDLKGGFNTASSLQSFLSYPGGRDYFGYDDGIRSLPSLVPRSGPARLGEGNPPLTMGELERVGESFAPVWSARRLTTGLDHGVSGTLGGTLGSNPPRFGYLLSASFSKSYRTILADSANLRVDGQSIVPRETYVREEGSETALLGALANFGLMLGARHKLTSTTLYTHGGQKTAELTTGLAERDGQVFQATRLRLVENELFFQLLQGRHRLAAGRDVRLDWQLNFARASRSEPDTRDLLYREVPGFGWQFRSQPGSGTRFFSTLVERGGGGGFDLTIPFGVVDLKTGFTTRLAHRAFEARRFTYQFIGDDTRVLLLPPEQLFSAANIGSHLRLSENTFASDQYSADVRLAAGYAMADLPSLGALRVVAGARFEHFDQALVSGSPFAPASDTAKPAHLASNDLLPALSLVYALGEQTNLRASYGTTVARPQLRELAPFLFFDFARRRNVQGNPDLQRSLIYNADARWELFPAAGQIVAVSAFYKYFSQPIERVIFDSSNNVTFQNVASAWTAGAEVELSTKLGFLHPALEPLTFGLNVTLAWSRVRLRPEQVGVQTDAERPMQGQSPYVVNVALNYAHPNSKTELTLLYNFFGPRIDEVGANFLPSVYERPFHRLDASVSHALAKGWRLRVSGSNLLNQPVSFQQGGLPIVRYRPGVQGGVTLSYSR